MSIIGHKVEEFLIDTPIVEELLITTARMWKDSLDFQLRQQSELTLRTAIVE
jgi:hypothetical protein